MAFSASQRAARMLAKGDAVEVVALATGLALSSVKRIQSRVRNSGVPRAASEDYHAEGYARFEEHRETVARMTAEGYTTGKIATVCGITKKQVYTIRDRARRVDRRKAQAQEKEHQTCNSVHD